MKRLLAAAIRGVAIAVLISVLMSEASQMERFVVLVVALAVIDTSLYLAKEPHDA